MDNFKLIHVFKCNDTIPVYKYKSTKTGITVIIAEIESPLVCGNFCLPVEPSDDDGLPHTLEHLIFLGSERYPYKGMLDLLSNRCLASGTNAWTFKDHTNFTIRTVGSEGFLEILPIYVDHILFPTLTDDGFVTEVHYVSGKGEDRGVVFCEMQNVENASETLSLYELIRNLFSGDCPYQFVTGGLSKNIRENLTIDRIREYHRKFFRAENLSIIIMGQIEHAKVFRALQTVEQDVLLKGRHDKFVRPWHSPMSPLTESVVKDIIYPSGHIDHGSVTIGWRGPSGISEVYDVRACTLLLAYLSNHSVSPLQKEFVELHDPYAVSIEYGSQLYASAMLFLKFAGVPLSKFSVIYDRLQRVLRRIHNSSVGIDMVRLGKIIHQNVLTVSNYAENNPYKMLISLLVGNVVYGNGIENEQKRLNYIDDLKKLGREPLSYWKNLIKKYLIGTPTAIIMAKPSIIKQVELLEEESKRIAERMRILGTEGLEEKDRIYQRAVRNNEVPISSDLLTSIPIPQAIFNNVYNIRTFSPGSTEQHPLFDTNKLPIYTYLHDFKSDFVYICLVMDTSCLQRHQRQYLPLALEAIGKSSVLRHGKILSHETVVAELEADVVNMAKEMGFGNKKRYGCGTFSHSVRIAFQVEILKYRKAVQLIKELLYTPYFTRDRIKNAAIKLLNDLTTHKKSPNILTSEIMRGLLYNKDSNHYHGSLLRQQKFLSTIVRELNSNPPNDNCVDEIDYIIHTLTKKKRTVLFLGTDTEKLRSQVLDPYSPWDFLEADYSTKSKLSMTPDWTLIRPMNEIESEGCIVSLPGMDSSFFSQCGPCINDYNSPDLPTLLVCIQYFIQSEGPFWRLIRGHGLAYAYDMSPQINEGLLYLFLYAVADVEAAYKQMKFLVNNVITNNLWEKNLYDSAKSSAIFKIVKREKNAGAAVLRSVRSYFQNVSLEYNRSLVQKISEVKFENLTNIATKYIKPLFDSKSCKTSIICHPSKLLDIIEGFKSQGHNLEGFTSLESTHLNEW